MPTSKFGPEQIQYQRLWSKLTGQNGHPRQRILANLHGEADLLSALAKLAARRDDLWKEEWRCGSEAGRRQILRSRYPQQFAGRQYSASERKEIDALMRQRDRLLARMPKIEDRSSCYSEGRGCHHEALFGDARSNPGRHQGL
jgi:hypothetical protein